MAKKTVDPNALKQLREEKGLSMEALAERANVDKQTINRLEHGRHPGTRQGTIDKLCRALDVGEAVLTGLAPRPKPEPSGPANRKAQMNQRVSEAVRNAFSLVALRYHVPVSQIVELAPFLFYLAAERSLMRRTEKVDAVDAALGDVEAARSSFPHLPNAGFYHDIEALHLERRSIESRDLFGQIVARAPLDWWNHGGEDDEVNPFSVFLREQGAEVGGAEFEGMFSFGSPRYSVCREDAEAIVGGDAEAVEAVMSGVATLHEMFRELKDASQEERAAWAKAKAASRRREIDEWLGDIDLSLSLGEAGQ